MRAGRPGSGCAPWRHASSAPALRCAGNSSSASRSVRVDIFGRAGERHPAERPAAFAEQRANVFRHEAGNLEGILDARLLGLRANVVAVVERHRAPALQRQHGLNVFSPSPGRDRRTYSSGFEQRNASASCERHPVRHVAFQRIVRAGLVGEKIWARCRGAPAPAARRRSCPPGRPRQPRRV